MMSSASAVTMSVDGTPLSELGAGDLTPSVPQRVLPESAPESVGAGPLTKPPAR